jgi:hypothetical protein
VDLEGPDAATATHFGYDWRNTRKLTAKQAGLTTAQMGDMELAWAIAFPDASIMRSQGAIVGKNLFYPVAEAGKMYALDLSDPAKPCVQWVYSTPGEAPLRTSVAYGVLGDGTPLLVFSGIDSTVHAVDPRTGKALWTKELDGALIEVDAMIGHLPGIEAVERLQVALDRVIDVASHPRGDWLESWGWWCIYGCNATLRHMPAEHVSMSMAIFTNKAVEIADRLDNWSLRERAFSLEQARRDRLQKSTGFDAEWVLDEDEVRTITGTMGRFPSFRETGWKILTEARIVGSA